MPVRGWPAGRWAIGAVLGTLAIAIGFVPPARADAPALTVTNLGQESAPIEVGQAPVAVAATNSCGHPFTFADESACPAGTWPPLGLPWGPIEDVAGGDVLRFEFGTPVSSVTVASTSNYEPELHDPDGRAIGNYDVVGETSVTATADPRVWLFTLPPLDVRAISGQGYTFSVVAQDEADHFGYPFGIRSPRYANELTKCSQAYYSTGFGQYLCLSNGGGSPPAPHHTSHRRRRCRKGFHRVRVDGRPRCVRIKKRHPGHHR